MAKASAFHAEHASSILASRMSVRGLGAMTPRCQRGNPGSTPGERICGDVAEASFSLLFVRGLTAGRLAVNQGGGGSNPPGRAF